MYALKMWNLLIFAVRCWLKFCAIFKIVLSSHCLCSLEQDLVWIVKILPVFWKYIKQDCVENSLSKTTWLWNDSDLCLKVYIKQNIQTLLATVYIKFGKRVSRWFFTKYIQNWLKHTLKYIGIWIKAIPSHVPSCC